MIPTNDIIHGDCREVVADWPDACVDAIVTDPPYGLEFMGKDWDHGVPGERFWRYLLRVAKPGAHLLAFGGTRTHHRLMCALEDAGWEIRDCLMWVYGSGFPKSLDVSKAIDKAAGAKRDVVGPPTRHGGGTNSVYAQDEWTLKNQPTMGAQTAPATEDAKRWNGWGTALKPAYEPIVLARKPLAGTVAQNVLEHGTGGLNIDGCRVGDEMRENTRASVTSLQRKSRVEQGYRHDDGVGPGAPRTVARGRWPANLIHDGSEEVLAGFPETPGQLARESTASDTRKTQNVYGKMPQGSRGRNPRGDAGSAARFFYCAKASKSERGEGNSHPTVKPLALMRYLVRLVCPLGGVVLDPFCGSGSTLLAAQQEHLRYIGIDVNSDYCKSARRRLAQVTLTLIPRTPRD